MDKTIPTVAVLMSTFNGEKYLAEQLDSIFAQEGVAVKLYVRDDGSADSTVKILNDYSNKHPLIVVRDGENVGPGESFMRLVYKYASEPDIDYYAFADQDDIWLPNKLSCAIAAIEKEDTGEPVLYSSNQYLYIDGRNVGNRHNEIQRTDLIAHLTRNTIAGCTFVFNKALATLIADAGNVDYRILKYRLHDAWIMLVAIACGKALYDNSSHMLYRIHSENTVGVKGVSLWKRVGRLQRFFVKRDDANLRMITAQELLRLFPSIKDPEKSILELYSNYQKNNRNKIKLALNKTILDSCGEKAIVFVAKVLLNFI